MLPGGGGFSLAAVTRTNKTRHVFLETKVSQKLRVCGAQRVKLRAKLDWAFEFYEDAVRVITLSSTAGHCTATDEEKKNGV